MNEMYLTFRSRYAKVTTLFLYLFYAVGVVGILNEHSQNLFIDLTKYALILNFLLLLIFHENPLNRKSVFVFSAVFIGTYMIEVAGVNTGIVFGQYRYGESLGLKLLNTPLLIGINWLMLSYSFYVVIHQLKLKIWYRLIIAATGMLVYDLILEQLASKLDMWHWQDNTIPLKNYIAWFIIALAIQFFFKATKVESKNRLALPTLITQTLFFIVLFIFKIM